MRAPENKKKCDFVKKRVWLALPRAGIVEMKWSMNLLQVKNSFHLPSFHLWAHIKVEDYGGKRDECFFAKASE